ncbi:AbiV family abortive infection protein [Sphingomonas sp. PP-CE-3A-406]|uniref:AbiV family abortive infection protein n=1 Tax=Sphingomonas sp. PP-CE-3A-406 TaxID=2135659 RepID=UPI000EF9BCFE|nr:AbiV family abortive infection protein [Sphingomonas sp. PP-CE-3A-406]RMB52178.1 AbiV family abortive infection protein [Sphingomonas sp. PP-CE-3A-406]
MTDEDVQLLIPIMENFGRLTDDATHLVKASSFPSAFVLNVIALEELGKVIQLRWSQLGVKTSSQKRSAHLQKQWAVACVLIAGNMLPSYKRMILGEVSNQEGMIELATAFIDSDERRFFERIAAVELDRSKQVGLYEDGVTIATHARDQIDAEFVHGLTQMTLACLPLVQDDLSLQLGGVFFEHLPSLKDQILADRDKY